LEALITAVQSRQISLALSGAFSRRFSGAKTALFGAARFRAPATPPPAGAPCLASQPLQSLARLNAHRALSFLSLREAQTPDMVVKQLFSIFHASFLFLKNSGTASSSSHVFPPPARNDIPVSSAFEKFPQTHAALNRFVQARPFYTSTAAHTTCAA
jgi:hypothetical protein